MSQVPIEFAQRFALDRVIRALRTHLADELRRVGERFEVQLDAPEPHYIFRIAGERATDIIANADVWVSVLPVSPLTPVDGTRRTLGPDTYCQRQTLDVEMLLVFLEPLGEIPEVIKRPDGVTDTKALEAMGLHAEYVALCSDVYAGALLHTALKYTTSSGSIHEVGFEALEPDVLVDEDAGSLKGVARVVIRITINTAVPVRSAI